MIDWIIDRLRERSTWLGLVSFAAAVGVTLSPEQAQAMIAAGMALAGLIATFTRG
jgi:hypothetical protein